MKEADQKTQKKKKKKKRAWERDIHRAPRKTFTYFWQSRRPHNAGLCTGERAEKALISHLCLL